MGFYGIDSPVEYLAAFGTGVMKKTGFLCTPFARAVLHPAPIAGNYPLSHALKGILALSQKRKLIT